MFHSNIVKLVLDTDFENKIKNIKTYYSKIARSLKNNFNIKISRHTISKWIKNKNNIYNNRLKKEHFIEFNKIPDFLCNRKSKLKR